MLHVQVQHIQQAEAQQVALLVQIVPHVIIQTDNAVLVIKDTNYQAINAFLVHQANTALQVLLPPVHVQVTGKTVQHVLLPHVLVAQAGISSVAEVVNQIYQAEMFHMQPIFLQLLIGHGIVLVVGLGN